MVCTDCCPAPVEYKQSDPLTDTVMALWPCHPISQLCKCPCMCKDHIEGHWCLAYQPAKHIDGSFQRIMATYWSSCLFVQLQSLVAMSTPVAVRYTIQQRSWCSGQLRRREEASRGTKVSRMVMLQVANGLWAAWSKKKTSVAQLTAQGCSVRDDRPAPPYLHAQLPFLACPHLPAWQSQ